MGKIKLWRSVFLSLSIYVLTALNLSAADIYATAETTYSASQTMDIGIITGVVALAASAIIIYFLRKRRR